MTKYASRLKHRMLHSLGFQAQETTQGLKIPHRDLSTECDVCTFVLLSNRAQKTVQNSLHHTACGEFSSINLFSIIDVHVGFSAQNDFLSIYF